MELNTLISILLVTILGVALYISIIPNLFSFFKKIKTKIFSFITLKRIYFCTIGLFAYLIYKNYSTLHNLEVQSFHFIYSLKYVPLNPRFVILILFLIILLACYVYLFFSSLQTVINAAREYLFFRRERLEIETILSENVFLQEPFLKIASRITENKLKLCKLKINLKYFVRPLLKRLTKINNLLDEVEKEKRIEERKIKLAYLKQEIEKKEKELEIKERFKTNSKVIYGMLDAYSIDIFKKEDLTELQSNALKQEGFFQTTEYSLFENKYITVLMKPVLNHSQTHIFLVWDTIRLLRSFKGVSNIVEHKTVNADITFKFKSRKFALEIETGTLLGKKKQEKEKVLYLDKNYPKRWMFIVSNKNLVQKYRKLGPSTPRISLRKSLEKMLKTV